LTSAGVLDTTFGNMGYARLTLTDLDPRSQFRGVSLDSNGKIVAGGTFIIGSGISFRIGAGVARFEANGTIDATYGENSGWTQFFLNDFEAFFFKSTLIDDEVYLSGFMEDITTPPFTSYKSAVVKFDSSGLVDTAWGTSGYVVQNLSSSTGTFDQADSVVACCDGGILVGGLTDISPGNPEGFIYRLDSTGAIDTNWASPSGILRLNVDTTVTELGIYNEAEEDFLVYAAGSDTTSKTITKFSVTNVFP
jgi:uncharacterized delta-60 repeat protein